MRRLFHGVPVILVMALLSCSGGGDGGEGAGEQAADSSAAAPEPGLVSDVTFRNLDGDVVRLSDYGRKILMVNYMETWHADSKALVPIMNEVQRKFFANVVVIGILTDVKSAALAKVFVEKNGVKFEVMLPHGDPGNFGMPGKLPTTHVVTREDQIIGRFDGLHRAKKYEGFILSMYKRRM